MLYDNDGNLKPGLIRKEYHDGSYYIGAIAEEKRNGVGIYYYAHGVCSLILSYFHVIIYFIRRCTWETGKTIDSTGKVSISMIILRFMRDSSGMAQDMGMDFIIIRIATDLKDNGLIIKK